MKYEGYSVYNKSRMLPCTTRKSSTIHGNFVVKIVAHTLKKNPEMILENNKLLCVKFSKEICMKISENKSESDLDTRIY